MDKDKNKASRRLTRKEQKRFDEFLDVKEEYIAQGFKEDSLTMSGLFVNVMANVIGLGVAAIAFILFIFVNKNRLPDSL